MIPAVDRDVNGVMLTLAHSDSHEPMSNVVPLPGKNADQRALERAAETRLLEQVRDHGDRVAFEELFTIFTPRLSAWISGQGCDPGAVDSVVQDVMIAAWTRAAQFDAAKASARTWIYTMARNRMIDQHRAGTRRRRAHDDFAMAVPQDTENAASVERGLNSARMADLLEQLPEEQRLVLLLLYVEGRTHREIAEHLDVPVGTIKSRARLAFQRLRKLIGDEA